MQSFLVALAFLTIIPIRFAKLPDEQTVARSRFWYPVVGLLLGCLLGGWTLVVSPSVLPTSSGMLSAFLVLAAWVVITGALHLDGFCDLCDGLFGGSTPDERLQIMKEPTRGTFAIAGAVLLLLGKFVLLSEAFRKTPPYGVAWLVEMAVAVPRGLVLSMAAGARYPRAEGTGKIIIDATRRRDVLFFLLASAMILGSGYFVTVMFFSDTTDWTDRVSRAFLAVPLLLLVLLGLRRLCERRLGGITGDCLGAAIELLEFLFLLVLMSLVPAQEAGQP